MERTDQTITETRGPLYGILSRPLLRVALVSVLAVAPMSFPTASAMAVTWGSEYGSAFVDSYGNPLDTSFYFQLGYFVETFTPSAANTEDWAANWRVFDHVAVGDAAIYNREANYFTTTAALLSDGSSSTSYTGDDLGLNYTGKPAYLWVFNQKTPGTGSEWMLVRDETWVFPAKTETCCDPTLPTEWSVSDLDPSDNPVWGSQSGIQGSGAYEAIGPQYTLQTYTLVPEPSGVLLVMAGGSALFAGRRRLAHHSV